MNNAAARSPIDARRASTIIAAIVASAFFMEMLDGAIINTSIPQMAASFHVRPVELSIGITVYLLATAAFIPLSGWLADYFGSRTIFFTAIAIFSLSSLACGLVDHLDAFIVARGMQGVGGAMMVPVGRVLIIRGAEKADLLRVTAIITWPGLLAPVIAPVLGGFITTYWTWKWNFFVNVPIGVIGLLLVSRWIPNERAEVRKALDVSGFLLSSAALTFLLYGLDSYSQIPFEWVKPTLWTALGGVLVVISIRRFEHTQAPLINLAAARIPTFALTTLTNGTTLRSAINATPFLLPLLFQVGFGLSAVESGVLLLCYFAGNVGIKPLTTPILRRYGFRTIAVVTGVVAGVAILAFSVVTPATPRTVLIVLLILAGASRSMQFTGLNSLAFADITPVVRSSASTLFSMNQQLSAVLGVSIAALVINVSQATRAGAHTEIIDFRVAFIVAGVLAIGAGLYFLKLPANAGAAVSGHAGPARRTG